MRRIFTLFAALLLSVGMFAETVTITYKFEDSVLGTETIEKGGTAADYVQYETRELCKFGGWYSDANLTDPMDLTVQTFNENAVVYAKYSLAYASSINIEKLVLDNGLGYDINSALNNLNYAYGVFKLDSLNDAKTARNEPYLGMNIETSGSYMSFNLKSGDQVSVKFGYVGAPVKVYSDGQEMTTLTPIDNSLDVWVCVATHNQLIKLETTTDNTVVIKQIMINEQIQEVTLPASEPEPTTYTLTLASNDENAETEVWFDITGRRLQSKPSKPGLYIRNGKKVVLTDF